MTRFHLPVFLAVAMLIGACAQSTSREQLSWEGSPQPIEPGALHPAAAPPPGSLIVLLPKPNGSIGGVVVRSEGGRDVLLNTAYAAARTEGGGQAKAFTYDRAAVKEDFGATLAALPGRPATFLLYFLEGKDQLTHDSEGEVARIFAEIANRPDPEISVIGHTDAVGTMNYNDHLSVQRAERVRDDLIQRGIPADRIEVSGRGKREPLVPTAEGVSEPKNRRVEISVR